MRKCAFREKIGKKGHWGERENERESVSTPCASMSVGVCKDTQHTNSCQMVLKAHLIYWEFRGMVS